MIISNHYSVFFVFSLLIEQDLTDLSQEIIVARKEWKLSKQLCCRSCLLYLYWLLPRNLLFLASLCSLKAKFFQLWVRKKLLNYLCIE